MLIHVDVDTSDLSHSSSGPGYRCSELLKCPSLDLLYVTLVPVPD